MLEGDLGGEDGIALYYHYVSLDSTQRAVVAQFYRDTGTALGLRGRVRVARDGVNVTVGGPWSRLEAHVAAVKDHPLIKGTDVDFKLAKSGGAQNSACRSETCFDRLRVVECDELVTLGAGEGRAALEHTARHLSPAEFHDMLSQGEEGVETVLLDARNLYESRIGYFSKGGVPVLRPALRQFSELPSWMDRSEEALRGKRVLMYCTGGVRCERASAYLRAKGEGFEDVYQLRGGIQRYLESYPDGGFFRGKNFVFDERVAVGPEASVVGSCLQCGCAWDDYSGRHRCASCRMLVLLCRACSQASTPPARSEEQEEEEEAQQEQIRPASLVCELCRERQRQEGGQGGGQSAARRRRRGVRRRDEEGGRAIRACQAPEPAPTSRGRAANRSDEEGGGGASQQQHEGVVGIERLFDSEGGED